MKKEKFNQVCVWPSTVLGDSPVKDFEEFFKDRFGVKIQFLEEVTTLPDKDKSGTKIKDTGGRIDILFAIHDEDVEKFAIPRFSMGIRWIEDAVGDWNNPNGIIYPKRILKYKTW